MPIRPATSSDLPLLQALARRTIDTCYRSFLGEEAVDGFVGSGASDAHVEAGLPNTWVVHLADAAQRVRARARALGILLRGKAPQADRRPSTPRPTPEVPRECQTREAGPSRGSRAGSCRRSRRRSA